MEVEATGDAVDVEDFASEIEMGHMAAFEGREELWLSKLYPTYAEGSLPKMESPSPTKMESPSSSQNGKFSKKMGRKSPPQVGET